MVEALTGSRRPDSSLGICPFEYLSYTLIIGN